MTYIGLVVWCHRAPLCYDALHWSTTILLSAFCKLIKDKSDALNPKITFVLLNQVKFLSYRHKSFLRFCSYIWLRWLCTVEVATKREAAGCNFVIM